jgi:hypothetical protein
MHWKRQWSGNDAVSLNINMAGHLVMLPYSAGSLWAYILCFKSWT